MAVRLHFVPAADSVFSRREKKTRKIVFGVRQEMETDFLRASADRFVASIAEVGSSLETDDSCFVDLDRCSIGFVIVDLESTSLHERNASGAYGLACTLGWYAGIFCRCMRVRRFTERDGGAEQIRSGRRGDSAVAN